MVAPVKIGRLRHKILLKARGAATIDGAGQRSYAYATFAETRAEIGPVTSGEVQRAHSFGARTNHLVKIRYRPGVESTMQVVFAGNSVTRTFVVNGVINPEEANVMLHLFCEELNAGAT